MILGQLIALEQLTDPGVNFCLGAWSDAFNCLHEFSLPQGNFKGRVTHCKTSKLTTKQQCTVPWILANFLGHPVGDCIPKTEVLIVYLNYKH